MCIRDSLETAFHVRQREPEHAAAGAGDAFFFCTHGAREFYTCCARLRAALDVCRGDDAEAFEGDGVHVQRVRADVEADGFGLGA